MWIVRYKLEGDPYIAYGSNPLALPNYRVCKHFVSPSGGFYPSCLKFIDPEDLTEPVEITAEEFDAEFGPVDGTPPQIAF